MKRRYRYDEKLKKMVEVGADFKETPRAVDSYVEDSRLYGKAFIPGADAGKNKRGEETALDNLTGKPLRDIDITSRSKHRRYMKERDLHLADDHGEEWKKNEELKQRIRETGRSGKPDPQRRAALEKAFEEVRAGKRFKESHGFSESERRQLIELAEQSRRR